MKDSTKKAIIDFVKKTLKYKEPTPFFLRPEFQQPIQEKSLEVQEMKVQFEIPSNGLNEETINYEIARSISFELVKKGAINYKIENCEHVLSFHHGALKEDRVNIIATFKYLKK